MKACQKSEATDPAHGWSPRMPSEELLLRQAESRAPRFPGTLEQSLQRSTIFCLQRAARKVGVIRRGRMLS